MNFKVFKDLTVNSLTLNKKTSNSSASTLSKVLLTGNTTEGNDILLNNSKLISTQTTAPTLINDNNGNGDINVSPILAPGSTDITGVVIVPANTDVELQFNGTYEDGFFVLMTNTQYNSSNDWSYGIDQDNNIVSIFNNSLDTPLGLTYFVIGVNTTA